MDENEKVVENVLSGGVGQDLPAGNLTPSGESMIESLNRAVDRAEAANKRTAELLDRQERMAVERLLGGTASAGAPPLSEESKARKAAKDFLAGTGFEQELFPDV